MVTQAAQQDAPTTVTEEQVAALIEQIVHETPDPRDAYHRLRKIQLYVDAAVNGLGVGVRSSRNREEAFELTCARALSLASTTLARAAGQFRDGRQRRLLADDAETMRRRIVKVRKAFGNAPDEDAKEVMRRCAGYLRRAESEAQWQRLAAEVAKELEDYAEGRWPV